MPKVLLISRDFPSHLGGITEYIRNIYSEFSYDELTVVAFYHPEQDAIDKTLPFKIKRTGRYSQYLGHNKFAMIPLLMTSIRTLLRDRKINIIHAEQIQTGLPAYIVSLLFRIPYWIFAYGMEIMTSDALGIKNKVYRNADKIIAISTYTQSLLNRSNLESSNIQIFSPGIPEQVFVQAQNYNRKSSRIFLNIDDEKIVILTVARLDPTSRYKGIDHSIEVIKAVSAKHKNILYYIVGGGTDYDYYKNIIESNNLQNIVHLVGTVSNQTKYEYYSASDIFLLPNRIEMQRGGETTEGFGIVFLESNTFGVPCIGGVGGAHDAINNNVSGLWVDPQSLQDIEEKLTFLIENSLERERIGISAKQRVSERYITENISTQFRNYITACNSRNN